MADNNMMCSVLELGISGDSYELIKNLCEDVGIVATEKDYMSIVLDVSDNTTVGEYTNVDLIISSDEITLQRESFDGDDVLLGFFPVGNNGAAPALNGAVENFTKDDGADPTEDDGASEEWTSEDSLSFVIAVGEIDEGQIELLQGKINTHISTTPLMFDEGDVVNMTLTQLGNFYIE